MPTRIELTPPAPRTADELFEAAEIKTQAAATERLAAIDAGMPARAKCGFTRDAPTQLVSKIVRREGHLIAASYFAGSLVCKSLIACQTRCTPNGRRIKVQVLSKPLAAYIASEGKAGTFQTNTLQHKAHDRPEDIFDTLEKCLRYTKNSTHARAIKESYEIEGRITAKEFSYGRNGFHIHSHEAILHKLLTTQQLIDFIEQTEPDLIPKSLQSFTTRLLSSTLNALWIRKAHRLGNRAEPRWQTGTPIQDSYGMASYLTKVMPDPRNEWNTATELLRMDLKQAKNGNLTPKGLLIAATGTQERWNEWLKPAAAFKALATIYSATKSRNSITTSRGLLKEIFGLTPEEIKAAKTDQVFEDGILKAKDDTTAKTPIYSLPPATHNVIEASTELKTEREAIRMDLEDATQRALMEGTSLLETYRHTRELMKELEAEARRRHPELPEPIAGNPLETLIEKPNGVIEHRPFKDAYAELLEAPEQPKELPF